MLGVFKITLESSKGTIFFNVFVFQAQYIFLHQSTLELLNNKGNSQSIWFVSYSALEKMDSLDAMEGKQRMQ